MNLTDGLTEHLQDVPAPVPDLDRVVRRGEQLRARRRVTGATVAAAGVLAVVTLLQPGGGLGDLTTEPPIASGPLDLSKGLRAYADPGNELHMGGRTFPGKDLERLDTDAVATSAGLVYFRGGQVLLLGEDGTSRVLWDGDADADPRATSKWDPVAGVVAFAVRDGSAAAVVVRDLTGDGRHALSLDCDGVDCDKVVVDAVDSGSVFVRTEAGTFRWEYAGGEELEPFAGQGTRVADVRNRTVLYDGPRPTVTLEGWTYVADAVDSQLTFDGRNIRAWSPVLKSIANDEAISLQLPQPATFFTIDTDGSVLAATVGDPATFFDCEVPSGRCEQIGRMRMTGGDPMFIGNDM